MLYTKAAAAALLGMTTAQLTYRIQKDAFPKPTDHAVLGISIGKTPGSTIPVWTYDQIRDFAHENGIGITEPQP